MLKRYINLKIWIWVECSVPLFMFRLIFQTTFTPYKGTDLFFSTLHTQVTIRLYICEKRILVCSRKYYYYWRLSGDPSETNMPDRRPRHASSETSTCFIGDWHAPSDTDMPDRRPKCPADVLVETNMPAESNQNFNTYTYI